MLISCGVVYALECEVGHFLLAFFAGLLAYLSMSIIYRHLSSIYLSTQSTSTQDFLTRHVSAHSDLYILLFSLSVALLSHVLEDYYFSIV